MRCCCWREVDEARVLGPCWAGAVVVIVRGAFVVVWKRRVESVALEVYIFQLRIGLRESGRLRRCGGTWLLSLRLSNAFISPLMLIGIGFLTPV